MILKKISDNKKTWKITQQAILHGSIFNMFFCHLHIYFKINFF